MLFRLVRPVKRLGSRYPQFVRRIPIDVKQRAAGLTLHIPVGDQTQLVVLSPRAQTVRLSLRTDDPSEVKARMGAIDAYLEQAWKALREGTPKGLTHKQATALGGELYRVWANGEGREQVTAIEHDPDFLHPEDHVLVRGSDGKLKPGPWRRVRSSQVSTDEWASAKEHVERIGASKDVRVLETTFGPLLDRLLLSKGIGRLDETSREVTLSALALALKDAFEARKRNAEGDYSPDPKAQRFPAWNQLEAEITRGPAVAAVSLKGLLAKWWVEARATGRKPSTYESYANTVAAFCAFLGHDDAKRVTRHDVVSFKDHRLASINPRNGKPISAKTVKDSDLSGLKTIFGWAKVNGLLENNPAEGVTIKLGKPPKLRSKGFSDVEAQAVLSTALAIKRGQEMPKMFAAKKWVPWLCAYTGGRVGELAQVRKQDVRREGQYWILSITPEAGPVKTNEAREVVLHQHLIELGFIDFVHAADPGHLFITPSPNGEVVGPLQSVKNRIAEFVRTVVQDKNVAPSHAWRHRFKTVGIEAGVEHRILDAIQGHRPRNVAEGYGEVSIKAQAAAIAKMPRYKVSP